MIGRILRMLKKLVPNRLVLVYHWIKAILALVLYRYPARALTVIGITGTDGKTTTSHMLFSILRAAGLPASLITTTGAIIYGNENTPLGLHVTTPNPFELQQFLLQAKEAGSKYIVLEATSHGLAQYRVLGCNFQIGVLTNITEEHLDYHGSYENYLQAKARLFRGVRTSILNLDDRSYPLLTPYTNGRKVTYGLSEEADLRAAGIEQSLAGTRFEIPQIGKTIHSLFLGEYNVYNMLAASAAALALGISPDAIQEGLENAAPPPGRLEKVDRGQPFTVYIDFAHTPNGLDSVLKLLRTIAPRRLIAVFGCAGDRDPGKRFPMGASAGRYADLTVITAEDPRTEDLEEIMKEVAAGCEHEGGVFNKTYFKVPDRAEAIRYAIQQLAEPGDIVITTGKAHERSMCFGMVEYPWDEFAAVHAALDSLGRVEPVQERG